MSKNKEELLGAMSIIARESLKSLKLDYTITAKIVSESDGLFTAIYNGDEIILRAREGLQLELGDIVYIRVVQGNFSEKFIDCKRP